jgi:hypothetical protein
MFIKISGMAKNASIFDQAVTNRLKLVVEFLSRAFEEKRDENEIRLLSIASGSAQAVIGATQKAPHLNARAHLPEIADDNPCRSPFGRH